MFFDTPVTLRETAMRQTPPLSDVFRVVFDYLRAHHDVVLFGSHAVNVYVEPPRMTADIDVMSPDAEAVAEDLRALLTRTFHIAVRVRTVAGGEGFRVYQLAQPKNRHLIDVRHAAKLPDYDCVDNVLVVTPTNLVASKIGSYTARRNAPKGLTDKADLHRLLAVFPELRTDGRIDDLLRNAPLSVRRTWDEIRAETMDPDDDDAW